MSQNKTLTVFSLDYNLLETLPLYIHWGTEIMFVGAAVLLSIVSAIAAILKLYLLAIPALIVAVSMLGFWAYEHANSG